MDNPKLTADQIDALWSKGILWWKLRPIQQLMYERETASNSLKYIENCSRRLGKTYKLVIRAIETAIQIPGATIPFAAPTKEMLRDIIKPIFQEVSMDAPQDYRPKWKSSESCYLIPHSDSQIKLAGVNNNRENLLRGKKAHLGIVDEGGFIDRLGYLIKDVLTPQLLTTNGKLLIASSPSRTPDHDFAAYCHEAMMEGNYSEYDIYKSGYPPELIERFRKEANGPTWRPGMPDSTTWLREYLCKFVVDANFAIIPEWREEYEAEHARDQYFQFYLTYEGMDMGAVDKTVVLFGFYDFKAATLIIEDEYVIHGPDMTTQRLANEVKLREKALWDGHKPPYRVADNNNPIMLMDLSSMHQLDFSPTQKTGRTERQTILEAMVNDLRMQVGAGRIKVNPRCKELIGCLRYGIWAENRRTFARSPVYGHYDALAALIYLNRFVDRATNPIPADYKLDIHKHYIAPALTKDPVHEELKKMFRLRGK